ncbi:hypothetical protein P7H43_05280 [Enterococcus asini]|uniref:Lipoprotein n=1 Tax=Enterococcus asini TaxID=57732 RepID=A0AAW8U1M8_9ENTE|nr:hypothetical protein [Enterococcus asini]MDT2809888.1 hypothetical protein [Enterococcus asini]
MKKGIVLGLVIVAGLLVGCRRNNETPNSSTEETTVQSSSTQESSTASSQSSSQKSSESSESKPSSSSSASSSSSSSANSSEKSNEPAASTEPSSEPAGNTPNAAAELAAMHSELRLPTVTAPNQKALNIASALEVNHLSVLYYAMDQPLVMNHRQLNNETPFASYQITSYGSAAEAQAAVNYVVDQGGQAVDLGYNITGHMQGAAGSTYLNWQEGKWSLTVRGINSENQDPVPVAKEMVAYLEEGFLPVPKSVGQVTVDLGISGYQKAQVVWQEDETVYRVTHQDPVSALKTAVSVK